MMTKEEAKLRLTSDKHVESYLKSLEKNRIRQRKYQAAQRIKRDEMKKEFLRLKNENMQLRNEIEILKSKLKKGE